MFFDKHCSLQVNDRQISDFEAVRNAVTMPWSNGQVEGQRVSQSGQNQKAQLMKMSNLTRFVIQLQFHHDIRLFVIA
jgi:hypothetical protein